MSIIIKAEKIGKQYTFRNGLKDTQFSAREILNRPFERIFRSRKYKEETQKSNTFWALKDINFEIYQGESVGLIGDNGAGKSTLLKIMSRITRPTEGRMVIYQKVSSLLEIGTGFNVELTGRDNIFLNGGFLGMDFDEIRSKLDEIIEFSEIEKFIDTPVKYYSSGMFLRLAFSIAVHLTPEILILDEVLAVGDASFQQKSRNKMQQLIHSGATILLVSHNLNAITDLCNRVIWLENGRIKDDGKAFEVVKRYLDLQ